VERLPPPQVRTLLFGMPKPMRWKAKWLDALVASSLQFTSVMLPLAMNR
jgi:hypothetical protein